MFGNEPVGCMWKWKTEERGERHAPEYY